MAIRGIPNTLAVTNFKIGSYSPSQQRYDRPYSADEYISEVGTTRFAGTLGLNPRDSDNVSLENVPADLDLIKFNAVLDRYRNTVRIPLPNKFKPQVQANSGAVFTLVRATLANEYSRRTETARVQLSTTGVTSGATFPITNRSWITIGNELYQVFRARVSNYGQSGENIRLDCYPNRIPLAIQSPPGWQTIYTFPSDLGTVSPLAGMVLFRRQIYVAFPDSGTFNTKLYTAAPTLGTGWSIREVYSGGFLGSGLASWQAPNDTQQELYSVTGSNYVSVVKLNVDNLDPSDNTQTTVGTYVAGTGSTGDHVSAAVGWKAPGDSTERLYIIRDNNKLYRITALVPDGVIVNQGASGTAKGIEHIATFPGLSIGGMAAFGDSLYFISSGGTLNVHRLNASQGLGSTSLTRIYGPDITWNGSYPNALDVWNGGLIALGLQGTPRTSQIAKINLTPASARTVEINEPFVMARLYADRQAGFQGPITEGITYDWREVAATIPPVDLYLPPLGLEEL